MLKIILKYQYHNTEQQGQEIKVIISWTLGDFRIYSGGVNIITNNEDKNSRHSTEKLHQKMTLEEIKQQKHSWTQ